MGKAADTKQTGRLRLGACSWTAKGWLGAFYPSGTKPADFISEYAKRYDSVEIDSTFYAVPKESTVLGWRDKTPDDFLFAAKTPKAITHDKFLEDCEGDLRHFLKTMSLLGDKLGPLLIQFPYYTKRSGVTAEDFLSRLRGFLALLPSDEFNFAVEVRNKNWLNDPLFDILHERGVALALIDHPWMAPPAQLFKMRQIVPGNFLYVRWLGDRHGIEKITKVFNESVVERATDIERWVSPIKDLLDGHTDVYGYVNNHYGGYAPDNIDQLMRSLA